MKKFIICSFIFLFCLTSVLAQSESIKKHHIFVVNSYNPETFGWTKEIFSGILDEFKKQGLEKGIHFEIVSDNMDALVKSSGEEKNREADRILNKIKQAKPDIIITTDDDALEFVGLKIDKIPVVFNGVNGEPGKYLTSPKLDSLDRPGHNITGVYQTTYFKQSLEFLRQLSPAAKTFGVLTDQTTTGLTILDSIKKIKDDLPLTWKDTFVSSSFSEWKTKIKEWQKSVDAVFMFSANSVKNDNGKTIPQDQVVQWIAENSKLPDTACWEFQVKPGILVSATDSGKLQGVHTAFLAIEIMNGTDPGSLSIITPPNGVPAMNGKRAEKLNLNIPPEVISVFVETGKIF